MSCDVCEVTERLENERLNEKKGTENSAETVVFYSLVSFYLQEKDSTWEM